MHVRFSTGNNDWLAQIDDTLGLDVASLGLLFTFSPYAPSDPAGGYKHEGERQNMEDGVVWWWAMVFSMVGRWFAVHGLVQFEALGGAFAVG